VTEEMIEETDLGKGEIEIVEGIEALREEGTEIIEGTGADPGIGNLGTARAGTGNPIIKKRQANR